MAKVVWGIGVEPECLTDRTQMCFYIIPGTGGSGGMITGGQVVQSPEPRQPKGRRGNKSIVQSQVELRRGRSYES